MDTELERLEALTFKLGHSLVDIRIRSINNLISKCKTGALSLNSPPVLSMIAKGIVRGLNIVLISVSALVASQPVVDDPRSLFVPGTTSTTADAAEPLAPPNLDDTSGKISLDEESSDFLHKIFDLIVSISEINTLSAISLDLPHPFTDILDPLYNISVSRDRLSEQSNQRLQQVIELLCTLGEKVQQRQCPENLKNLTALSTLCDVHPSFKISESLKLGQSGRDFVVNKGAGAIMSSSLVFVGWKFPRILLSQSDERYLFDIEVKVKLNHPESLELLMNVLADFPPQVLLARPGLLQIILDTVGATHCIADLENKYQSLHSLTAITWLQSLMMKLSTAFQLLLDGSMCNTVPSMDVSNNISDSLKRDVVKSFDILLFDGTNFGAQESPSLAMQMARQMYLMRYPRLRIDPDDSNFDTQTSVYTAHTTHVPPVPSISGFAFACVAAALPLLQTRSIIYSLPVTQLAIISIPFICEPSPPFEIEEGRSDTASRKIMTNVDRNRLQHIFNRIEQIFQVWGEIPDALSISCLLRTPDLIKLAGLSCDSLMIRLFIALLINVPVTAFSSQNDLGGDELTIGQLSYKLLKQLLIHYDYYCSEAIVIELQIDRLAEIMNHIDKDALGEIARCQFLCRSALRFRSSQNSQSKRIINFENIIEDSSAAVTLLLQPNIVLDSNETLHLNLAAVVGILFAVVVIDDFHKVESENIDSHHRDSDLKAVNDLFENIVCNQIHEMAGVIFDVLNLLVSSADNSAQQNNEIIEIELCDYLDRIVPKPAGEELEIHSGILSLSNMLFQCLRGNSGKPASNSIISALASFRIFRSIIAKILVTEDAVSKPSANVSHLEKCRSSGLKLLNSISEFILTEIPEKLEQYSELVIYLKLIVWKHCDYGSAIVEFTQRLEDFCAAASDSDSREQYRRSIILGWFHNDAIIRRKNLMTAAHDLRSVINAEIDSPVEIVCWTSLQWLSDSDISSDVKSVALLSSDGTKKNRPIFSHKDLTKVADIGLFNCSDPIIRVSALRQMRDMLISNSEGSDLHGGSYHPFGSHLLETADSSWRLKITWSLVQQLSACCDNLTGENTIGSTWNVLREMSQLLLLLVQVSDSILQSLCFGDDQLSESSISIWGLVRAALLLGSTPKAAIGTLVADLYSIVAITCQCQFSLHDNLGSWANNKLAINFSKDHVLLPNRHFLQLPPYFAQQLGFPLISKTAMSGYPQWLSIRNDVGSNLINSEAAKIIKILLSSSLGQISHDKSMNASPDSLLNLFECRLSSLSENDNLPHFLQEIASISHAIPYIFVGQSNFLVEMSADESHTISNLTLDIIINSLRTARLFDPFFYTRRSPKTMSNDTVAADFEMLKLQLNALKIVNLLVTSAVQSYAKQSTQLSEDRNAQSHLSLHIGKTFIAIDDTAFDCLVSLTLDLIPYIENSSSNKLSASQSIKNARLLVEGIIETLLPIFCFIRPHPRGPGPSLQLLQRFILKLITIQGLEIIGSQAIRTKAAHSAIKMLSCYNHAVPDDLNQSNKWSWIFQKQEDGGPDYSIPFDKIIQSIKVLRSPDSFRFTGTLSGSLKLLWVSLTYADNLDRSHILRGNQWHWITRFIFDRRGDIKLLVMNILNSFDAANINSLFGIKNYVESNQETDIEFDICSHITHIVHDAYESLAVRLSAMSVLSKFCVSPDRSSLSSPLQDSMLQDLLVSLCDFMEVSNTSHLTDNNDEIINLRCLQSWQTTCIGTSLLFQLLFSIFGNSNGKTENENTRRVVLETLKKLKFLPKITRLLSNSVSDHLLSNIFRRSNLWHISDARIHQWIPFQLHHTSETKQKYQAYVYITQVLVLLERVDSASKNLYHAAKCTSLHQDLIRIFTIDMIKWRTSIFSSTFISDINDKLLYRRASIAINDLFAFTFQLEVSNSQSDEDFLRRKNVVDQRRNLNIRDAETFEDIVSVDASVALHMFRSLCSCIHHEFVDITTNNDDDDENISLDLVREEHKLRVKMLTGTLKGICLILSSRYWRSGLQLGGPYEDCLMSSSSSESSQDSSHLVIVALELFRRWRLLIGRFIESLPQISLLYEPLGHQFDLAISLLLINSQEAKQFMHRDLPSDDRGGDDVPSDSTDKKSVQWIPFLRDHCKNIVVEAENLVNSVENILQWDSQKLNNLKVLKATIAANSSNAAIASSRRSATKKSPENIWRDKVRSFSTTNVNNQHKKNMSSTKVGFDQNASRTTPGSPNSPASYLDSKSPPINSESPFSENTIPSYSVRKSLWSSLILLQAAMVYNQKNQAIISEMVGGYKDLSSDPFFTLLKLSKLLANPRIVGNITQSNRVGSSKMTSSKSKLHGAITGPHQKSGFSYEKLCASILAFLTSFVFSNSANKTLLVTAKAAIISNQPSAHSSSIISGSKVLHFLLTSALPSGDGATGPRIPQAIRGIYFQLLISCLNNTSSSATLKDSSLALGYSTGAIIIKQKTALTKILTEHIENIVRKGGHEDLAAVPSLLEALAACLSAVGDVICHDGTAESDDRGPMVITTPDTDTLPSTFMVHGNFNSTTPHTLHTPLPALVRWIVESRSCFKSVDIMTSLVRCIGRVASCHHLTNGNLSSNASSTRSKFLASVSSEDCIFLLVRSLGSSNYALRTSALISLWTLVHNSEQAKAVMKRSVEKLKSQDLLDIGSCIDNFVVTDEEIENDSNTNTGQVHSIDEISIRKARAALRAILSSN